MNPVHAALFAAACLLAPPLHAEVSSRLTYQAPDGCASEAEFVRAVSARGGKLPDDTTTSNVTRLDVTVRSDDLGFVGSLRTETRDGPSREREVRGETCHEVVEGLSVVAALALGARADANAEGTVAPPTIAAAPPPSASGAPPPATAKDKNHFSGTSLRSPERIDVEAGALRFDRARAFTLLAGAEFGLVPNLVLPRYDLTTSIAHFVTPPDGANYLVGSVLRVHWTGLGPASRHDGDLSTEIYGMQAGFDTCAAFTYNNRGFTLLGCGEFGAGWIWLDTTSDDGTYSKNEAAGFGVVGVGLDASYSFGKLFHISLRAGGDAKAGLITASRPDGSRLFEPSFFGAHVSAGFGFHF